MAMLLKNWPVLVRSSIEMKQISFCVFGLVLHAFVQGLFSSWAIAGAPAKEDKATNAAVAHPNNPLFKTLFIETSSIVRVRNFRVVLRHSGYNRKARQNIRTVKTW
ncbi:hypothetical protein ABLO27_05295 [Roseibium sp. SCPC15]|uniref:hypothetical protein n=1 Tax=Roseibium sp. SCP15 TaxID=3141376 RepID=UPI00333CF2C2